MTRLWNWDFEDERPARRKAPASPPPPLPLLAPPRRRVRLRRGRALGAGALALAALAALALALSGSGTHARAHTHGVLLQRPHAPAAPSDTPAEQRAAVDSVLAYTPFVRAGGGRGREIALTFDDGPGPYTPQVLDALERLHVKATFFAVGKMERYFSSSTLRELADGDAIGNHTESHLALASLSAHDQHEQLLEGDARVELLGAPRPVLFRPPYGSFDATTLRELRRMGLLMVLWSADTDDYLRPGVPAILERALAGAHPGAILLLHDAGGDRSQTVAALPQIIAGLRRRGYRLVTVPQLLRDDPPPRGQPLPPSLSGD
jgi:peptidoglycan/xylan/chitin deacetylase (PgdA/CDA1 family)